MTQDEETSELRNLSPDALRARLKAGARAQRGQAVSIIHFWRGVTLVQRRRLWEAWEFKSFHDYCREDLDLRTRRYIRERMAIGDLSVSRYEGCALGVDVLVRLVDLELVEQDAPRYPLSVRAPSPIMWQVRHFLNTSAPSSAGDCAEAALTLAAKRTAAAAKLTLAMHAPPILDDGIVWLCLQLGREDLLSV